MADSGAIRAGRAFVELFATDTKLVAGLNIAERKIRVWAGTIAAIGRSLFLAGLFDLGLAAGALTIFSQMGSAISDMADQTGIGIEALQELGFAAEQSGSDLGSVVAAIGKMQKFLAGNEAARGLRNIGLSLGELSDLRPDEQFQRIADAIAAVENPANRTAAAMQIFGRAGAQLMPTILALSAERQRARDAGLIVSAADVRAAEAFGDQISMLVKTVKVLAFNIGATLVPAASRLVSWLQKGAQFSNEWAKANGNAVIFVAGRAVLLVALGAALMVLAKVMVFAIGPVLAFLAVMKFLFITVGLSIVQWIAYKIAALASSVANLIAAGSVSLLNVALGILNILLIVVTIGVTLLALALTGLLVWGLVRATMAVFEARGAMTQFQRSYESLISLLREGELEAAMELAFANITIVWERFSTNFAIEWNAFWFSLLDSMAAPFRLLPEFVRALNPVASAVVNAADAGNRDMLRREDRLRAGLRRAEQDFEESLNDADAAAFAALDARLVREMLAEEAAGAGLAGATRGGTSGTFSGAAAGLLGSISVEERQLIEQRQANEIARQIRDRVDRLQQRWQ